MKKRVISLFIIVAVLFGLTGCGSITEKQDALKKQGVEKMSEGDFENAVKFFDEALGLSIGEICDQEIDICYYKAASLYNLGRFDEAVSVYTALAEYDSTNMDAYYLRGCAYANENEMEKAIKDFEKSVSKDTDNVDRYIQIYENLEALNHHDEALGFLSMALAQEGTKAINYENRGRVYIILEKYDQAEKALKMAIEKGRGESNIYLAKVYNSTDRSDEAVALLESYIKNNKDNAKAMAEIGDLAMETGDYETALKYYEKGIKLQDTTYSGRLLKGRVAALEYLGRFSEARDALTLYLEAYPTDEEASREAIFLQSR